jgi:hypothetical protein
MSTDRETSDRVEQIVKDAKMPVTVAYVTKKTQKSWPTCRVVLLKLVAEGKIIGEQVRDGGWTFRAKQQTVVAELNA